jgi:hypothetical protein
MGSPLPSSEVRPPINNEQIFKERSGFDIFKNEIEHTVRSAYYDASKPSEQDCVFSLVPNGRAENSPGRQSWVKFDELEQSRRDG